MKGSFHYTLYFLLSCFLQMYPAKKPTITSEPQNFFLNNWKSFTNGKVLAWKFILDLWEHCVQQINLRLICYRVRWGPYTQYVWYYICICDKCFQAYSYSFQREGKTPAANTRDFVELQHRPVKFPSVSSHKYLDHLSKEEKQRYVNILGTCDPYTAPAAVLQSLKTAKSLPELHTLSVQKYKKLNIFSIWMGQ